MFQAQSTILAIRQKIVARGYTISIASKYTSAEAYPGIIKEFLISKVRLGALSSTFRVPASGADEGPAFPDEDPPIPKA
jgi:hypothetical protein